MNLSPDHLSANFIARQHGNTYCPTGRQEFSPRRARLTGGASLRLLCTFCTGLAGMLAAVILLGAFAP